MAGTCHHLDADKYRLGYSAEAQYRVTRRFDLRFVVRRLLQACVHIAPWPQKRVRLAQGRARGGTEQIIYHPQTVWFDKGPHKGPLFVAAALRPHGNNAPSPLFDSGKAGEEFIPSQPFGWTRTPPPPLSDAII